MSTRWEQLSQNERRICEEQSGRLVRRLIHTEDNGVEDVIFNFASNNAQHTIREWLDVLNNLEGCEQTLDQWLNEEHTPCQ